MAEQSGRIDRKSFERIARVVRTVEGNPLPQDATQARGRQRFGLHGVASEPIPYRGSGQVVPWFRADDGTETADPDVPTITAWAWCVPSGKRIPSGDEVLLIYDGVWYCVSCTNCLEDIPA